MKYILPFLVFIPVIALAQAGAVSDFSSAISIALDNLVRLIFGAATVVFVFSLVKYVAAAGSEAARTEAKQFIKYGLIILVVAASVWGIVNLILASLDLKYDTLIPVDPVTSTGALSNFVRLVVQKIIIFVLPLLIGASLVLFLWNLLKYLASAGNSATKKSAITGMSYGIVALVVMAGFWGFVNLALGFFDLEGSVIPQF